MTLQREVFKDANVGASKVAKGILGSLDRRLVEPAGILVRFSGWLLLTVVAYLSFFGLFHAVEQQDVNKWIILYAFYLLGLEIFRKTIKQGYDSTAFRVIRILINLIMVSILIGITPSGRYLLAFAYTVPIFATIVYFSEKNWVKFSILFLALFGLYIGGVIFSVGDRLDISQFLVISFALTALGYIFERFRLRVNLVPGRLTEIAKEFYKTLDLQLLMKEILKNAVEITQAERGLIIVINPRTKRYVGHSLHNFILKADCSIDELAKMCFVLIHGESFENPDIVTAFSDRSVYHKFFEAQPRSIVAEPFYNKLGEVIGVINVARNDANGFDKISKKLLREFTFLVGNSIENCFEHREVKIRELKSREVSGKFTSTNTEDDAVQILIEEARQQIPHAEKLTLHKFMPQNGDLLPIYNIVPETTPRLFIWSNPIPKEIKPDLRLGYGIAGHALEAGDTLLIHDVDHHPWFVPLDHAQNIKSLLVAPLFNSENFEMYGTLSLESSKPFAFNLDDESQLTYLSIQASRTIARIKDFQGWREQGGILRRMLEEIRSFDVAGSENTLCEQITDAATRLLGFKIARIRLLSPDNMLITAAVTGISDKARKGLMGTELSFDELKPFLNRNCKAESSYLIKHETPGWKKFVDKYFYKPRQVHRGISGWDVYDALITPLLDPQGEIFGILTLDLPSTGSEPTKQLLELIGVFANAASWIIELSRFQRRLKDQKSRAQSFIDAISQDLTKGRDLATIGEVVVQVGAKLLSAEGCSLYMVRGNNVVLTHSNYLASTDYISRWKPVSSQPKCGLTAWVACNGQTLCFNNGEFKNHEAWAGEESHLSYLPSRVCRSVLLAPIKDKDGNSIGVLTLENKKTIAGPKGFDNEDIARLESLANEFAKALEVIGLYEDIREWDRSGLADDLHDLINWYHSGVVMWIEALEVWMDREKYEKARELVPDLRKHAITTVLELKELHTNLLKNSFEAEKLKQALEETISAWTKRFPPKYESNMQITLDCPDNLDIPAGIKNTLVRITSLAVSNAIQHSGIIEDSAIQVRVCVTQRDNEITLEIIDNGHGIDFERTPEGFGLGRIRQLADKINTWGKAKGNVKSNLDIDTKVDQGTKIVLRVMLGDQIALS